MKKIIITLSCLLLVSACGCSDSDDNEKSKEESSRFIDDKTYTACVEMVNLCDDIIDGNVKPEYCLDEFEKYYSVIQAARTDSDNELKLQTIKTICDTMKIEIEHKNYSTKKGEFNVTFEFDLKDSRNNLAAYVDIESREID